MTTLTYRYKLDSAILEQLRSFAGNHRYDEAIIFREAWKGWLIDNKVIIDREIARLREIGYIKDVKVLGTILKINLLKKKILLNGGSI